MYNGGEMMNTRNKELISMFFDQANRDNKETQGLQGIIKQRDGYHQEDKESVRVEAIVPFRNCRLIYGVRFEDIHNRPGEEGYFVGEMYVSHYLACERKGATVTDTITALNVLDGFAEYCNGQGDRGRFEPDTDQSAREDSFCRTDETVVPTFESMAEQYNRFSRNLASLLTAVEVEDARAETAAIRE